MLGPLPSPHWISRPVCSGAACLGIQSPGSHRHSARPRRKPDQPPVASATALRALVVGYAEKQELLVLMVTAATTAGHQHRKATSPRSSLNIFSPPSTFLFLLTARLARVVASGILRRMVAAKPNRHPFLTTASQAGPYSSPGPYCRHPGKRERRPPQSLFRFPSSGLVSPETIQTGREASAR